MLVAIITDGTTSLDSYYVTDVFGIGTKELAAAFVLVGVGTVVCQMVLLKPAVTRLGERGVLIGACICIVLSKTGYFLVGLLRPHWKWFVYFQYTVFAPLVLLVFPAVSAMKANVCPPSKQGQIQGALFGVRTLAQAVCPPIFAAVYSQINGKHFPDHPSTTYLALAITALIATACAVSIPRDWNAPKYLVPEDEDDESDKASDGDALDEPLLEDGQQEEGDAPRSLPTMTTLRRGASLFAPV